MTAEAPDSTATRTTPRRRWWQFSLMNLLLVVVIVSLMAAIYASKQELREAIQALSVQRAKIEEQRLVIAKYDDRLGIMTISNENKLYLQARRTEIPYHWRWRIHLPKATEWNYVIAVGTVGDKGFETERRQTEKTHANGQFEFEVSMKRELDGSFWMVFKNLKRDPPSVGSRFRMTEEQVDSIRRRIDAGAMTHYGWNPVETNGDGPQELLRIVSGEESGENIGLLIFVERIPKPVTPEVGMPPSIESPAN